MYFAGMKTLQVRNLPDKTHAVLRRRAPKPACRCRSVS
jgi:plasmid stability protein